MSEPEKCQRCHGTGALYVDGANGWRHYQNCPECQVLAGIEFVGGPLDGRKLWGNVNVGQVKYPCIDGTQVVYRPSGAIKAGTGDCEFVYVGSEPAEQAGEAGT